MGKQLNSVALWESNYIFDSPRATCRIQSRNMNPEGDSVLQPRVGVFSANPGKRCGKRSNPNGVASTTQARANIHTDTTPSGLQLIYLLTQGWLKNANPGLEDRIPSGFADPISGESDLGDSNILMPWERVGVRA